MSKQKKKHAKKVARDRKRIAKKNANQSKNCTRKDKPKGYYSLLLSSLLSKD